MCTRCTEKTFTLAMLAGWCASLILRRGRSELPLALSPTPTAVTFPQHAELVHALPGLIRIRRPPGQGAQHALLTQPARPIRVRLCYAQVNCLSVTGTEIFSGGEVASSLRPE